MLIKVLLLRARSGGEHQALFVLGAGYLVLRRLIARAGLLAHVDVPSSFVVFRAALGDGLVGQKILLGVTSEEGEVVLEVARACALRHVPHLEPQDLRYQRWITLVEHLFAVGRLYVEILILTRDIAVVGALPCLGELAICYAPD